MVIKLNNSKVKKPKIKYCFLFFPLVYRGRFYWLEKVKIQRAFNGRVMKITNVEILKH